MSRELWATYSVNDHLAGPRAFAADVMLFDRLVFPVPEDSHSREGPLHSPGPVEWTRNVKEWERWNCRKWDPEKQERLLELLHPVIRKVAWDSTRKEEWRVEVARTAADETQDYAFVSTRTVLTRDLPSYVMGVEAVGPAYRSFEELKNDLRVRDAGEGKKLPGGALGAVLGWEFLVPDDKRLSDEQLLRETVDFVTGDAKVRRTRSNLLNWQQQFLKYGATDLASIEHAVEEMQGLLEDQRAAARKLKIRKTVRYAFWVAAPALSLALAVPLWPAAALLAAAGGVFLSLGGIAVEERLFKDAEQDQPSPAVFLHDTRRHFGWK